MTLTKKDPHVERVLMLMNSALKEVEHPLLASFSEPKHPIIFVIGAQRSGTTVLTQTLASLYRVSYPSNLMARFWMAPYIGAHVSRSLGLSGDTISFQSSFGATGGATGPHEFSYFWRHWFPGSAQTGEPSKLPNATARRLKQQLAAWQSVNDEPLLFKNLLEVIPNIQELADLLPTAVFVNILRDDLFVIQSTYESRLGYAGDHSEWFGVKPRCFRQLMESPDPLLQVVQQVHCVKRDISKALALLPTARFINLSYEDFVREPRAAIALIEERSRIESWRRKDRNVDALPLRHGNEVRLSAEQIETIRSYQDLVGRVDS